MEGNIKLSTDTTKVEIEQKVLSHLRKLHLLRVSPDVEAFQSDEEKKRNGWNQFLLLGLTLLAFFVTGWLVIRFGDTFYTVTVQDFSLLIVALLIHEIGHYLGMRYFGYRDLKMFFIPFFGAAVYGRSVSISIIQEAVVILLGPAPGLFIAAGCGFLFVATHADIWRRFALIFFYVNGFNLLPLPPLDGGSLLFRVCTAYSLRFSAILQWLTLLVLFPIVFIISDSGVLCSIWFLSCRSVFYNWIQYTTVSKVMSKVNSNLTEDCQEEDGTIPETVARSVMAMMQQLAPQSFKSENIEEITETVIVIYTQVVASSPHLMATITILVSYSVLILVVVLASLHYGLDLVADRWI